MFSMPVNSGWKPVPICSSAWIFPFTWMDPSVGLRFPDQLEQGALAGAIAANDADPLSPWGPSN